MLALAGKKTCRYGIKVCNFAIFVALCGDEARGGFLFTVKDAHFVEFCNVLSALCLKAKFCANKKDGRNFRLDYYN